MISRLLLLFMVLPVLAAFGQRGFFGPVTTRLKAGDFAPDLVFTQTLHAAESVAWSPANLSGMTTVLVFFPDTTHNLQSVTAWNALIDHFAGKPVQFVWITAEKMSRTPVHGWVFLDAEGQTGRCYGLERPQTVFIAADRKIVGFDMGFVPQEDLLNAVLEGRIATTPIGPGKAAMKSFIESNLKLLQAEPFRMERFAKHRPDFPPSYTVHIARSQGEDRGNFGGDDFWSLQGYDLKSVVEELYDLRQVRIDLPAALDTGTHYDFSLVLPQPESREKMRDRFRQGLQNYFHITATRQERLMDAYVVTAPNGKPPALPPRSLHSGGFSQASSLEFLVPGATLDDALDIPKAVSVQAISRIDIDGTVDDFCRLLESMVDRPVVNETNLQGLFSFSVKRSEGAGNDFLDRLREQTGLEITPRQRTVEILAFETRKSF